MPDSIPAADIRDAQNPLRGICAGWYELIAAAQRDKHEKFQKYANECDRFFNGPPSYMWDQLKGKDPSGEGHLGMGDGVSLPTFQVTVNKLFEAVAIYGPMLYHANPDVHCTARNVVEVPLEAFGLDPYQTDPMVLMQYQQLYQQNFQERSRRESTAQVVQALLNWLQLETDKRAEFRLSISEMVIKGGGCLWTEGYTPPGSRRRIPRTTWDSINSLVVDPDATRWNDVTWVARKRCRPIWETARRFDIPPEALKGTYGSHAANSVAGRRRGTDQHKDTIEYWEVYSKMGMGQRIHKMESAARNVPFDLESFGDYCYLVVAKDIPFPLNMPNYALVDQEDSLVRSQWPIPFWLDNPSGGWPVTMVKTYDATDSIWPISIGKMVLGELKFVNWAFSYMADRVAAGSKNLVGVVKECAEQLRSDIQKSQGPFTVIELSEVTGKKISDVISFLEAPDPGMSLWNMINATLEQIDKRTGLTELMYGMASNQIRSATEAQVRSGNMAIRPDDMAECVEAAASQVARKEGIAMHWLMSYEDVLPVLGPVGALYYTQFVETLPPEQFVRDYDVRIEAGSARKPNRLARQQQLNEFGQSAAPLFQAALSMGNPGPYNAWVQDVADSLQLDGSRYFVQAMMPPPMPPQETAPPPEQ